MPKTNGDIELVTVIGRQFSRNMMSKGRRTTAQVHGIIHDPPAHAPNQLRLGMGRRLKMDAANRSLRPRIAVIVLHKTGVGARSEEHTSELQSLMHTAYAVFVLKKKKSTSHNQ